MDNYERLENDTRFRKQYLTKKFLVTIFPLKIEKNCNKTLRWVKKSNSSEDLRIYERTLRGSQSVNFLIEAKFYQVDSEGVALQFCHEYLSILKSCIVHSNRHSNFIAQVERLKAHLETYTFM